MSLHLNKLILTNFKNYEKQSLDCSPRLNCIVGQNGMGKTNLLDAIYYLCMGKSHFSGTDRNVVKHDEDFFRLEGHFSLGEKKEKIVAKVIPGKKKDFEKNDIPYKKLSEHIGLLPVVFTAPDDTEIAMEGSEMRRRFMDNTLSQTDSEYLNHLIQYNTLLKQRNALLKQFGENRTYNQQLIDVYDEQMTAPANHIFNKRKAFLEVFNPVLQKIHYTISGEKERVNCRYKSQLEEADLKQLFSDRKEKDRILERTTAGIHRDDLSFALNDYQLKRFASQGQLKSFVLGLKLAQYDFLKRIKGIQPILLLDDIFDKLDRERVKHLLQLLIKGDFGQIFISDTDENRVSEIIEKLGADFMKFKIESGKVVEV